MDFNISQESKNVIAFFAERPNNKINFVGTLAYVVDNFGDSSISTLASIASAYTSSRDKYDFTITAFGYQLTEGFCSAISYDSGRNWSILPGPFTERNANVNTAATNGTIIITGGYSSTFSISRSSNGIAWTPGPTGSKNPFEGVGCSNLIYDQISGLFVGVQDSLVSLSSDYGLNWGSNSDGLGPVSGKNSYMNSGICVATPKGRDSFFILVGSNTETNVNCATSFNGFEWTKGTDTLFNNGTANGVCWGSITFSTGTSGTGGTGIAVAVGSEVTENYTASYSYDGINWNTNSNPFVGGNGNYVCWSPLNGGTFCAVGSGSYTSAAISTDGFTWETSNPFGAGLGKDHYGSTVIWNGSYFIAGGVSRDISTGKGSCIAISSDGLHWKLSMNLLTSVRAIIANKRN